MVIIPSNEATGSGENTISSDLDRPFFPPLYFFTMTKKKESFSYQAAASFNFLRLKEEESQRKKSDRWFGLTLATQSVSGKWWTAQREKKGTRRVWKGWRKKNRKVWWPSLTLEPCCLCPLSFWLYWLRSLLLSFWPLPVSFFPTDLMLFRRPLGQSRYFWMGHKSATGIRDRVKVVRDGRDKARQLYSVTAQTMNAHVLRDTWTDFKRNDFLIKRVGLSAQSALYSTLLCFALLCKLAMEEGGKKKPTAAEIRSERGGWWRRLWKPSAFRRARAVGMPGDVSGRVVRFFGSYPTARPLTCSVGLFKYPQLRCSFLSPHTDGLALFIFFLVSTSSISPLNVRVLYFGVRNRKPRGSL